MYKKKKTASLCTYRVYFFRDAVLFYKIRLQPITIQGFVELSKCQLESKSVGSVLKDDKSTAIQQN